MIRGTASILGEICHRHDAATCVPNGHSIPMLAPYEVAVLYGQGYGTIELPLGEAISVLRNDFELVEIYVQSQVAGVFEPLIAEHFALSSGRWVIVARKRHPGLEPRIVGIMLAKDEADVVGRVIEKLSSTLHMLYYAAGDPQTAEAIVAVAPANWARAVPPPISPSQRYTDGFRQNLLDAARADAVTDHDPRPLWVMVVQGDEIYHDDLRFHIDLAQKERATVMTCQVATFLIHESQREGWNWSLPIEERLTHYIWDFGEHTGFLDFPWIHYRHEEHMRAHPHGIYPAKWASARPVRKHYPFRYPDQAHARVVDRLASGWQPHYKHYVDIFMGAEAAGRLVQKFWNWFPEAERVGGLW